VSTKAANANVARRSRQLLGSALAALALVYLLWFYDDPYRGQAMVVFVAPPLLLMALLMAGRARAAFWAGVAGLLWFSHAVMLAWVQPQVRFLALIAMLLAVVIVIASSLPGLYARFSRKN